MNCPKCSALLLRDASACASCGAQVTIDIELKDPLLGQILDHKYIVKKRLGGGGFGAVYLAEEPSFDRKVAIKTMHSHHIVSPMLVGRFQREGMAASKLEHPCAVRMFNYGKTPEGIPWLAMEFLEGETLGDLLEREGPLSPAVVRAIFVPICEVLEEAHERGIIHRDLKPDNIMLVSSRGKMQPKLLDFGIAALLDDPNELTKTGVMSGTPTYMPPEQWEGLQATDARSDIYSLGFILYQCLAGQLPFTAESTPAWIRKHCFEPAPALSVVAPGLPAALAALVMKAIEKKPGDRYQTVAELRRALQASLQAESESFDSEQTMMVPVFPKKQPTPLPTSISADFEKTSIQQSALTQVDPQPSPLPRVPTFELLDEAVTSLPGALSFGGPAPSPSSSSVPISLAPEPAPPKAPAEVVTFAAPSAEAPRSALRWVLPGLGLLLLGAVGWYLSRPASPEARTAATMLASAPRSAPVSAPTEAASQAASKNPLLFPRPTRPGRFWANEDGTVTDSVTGLVWAESDNGANVSYDEALAYLKSKGPNWRMPTASELKELYLADVRKGTGALKLTGHYLWADQGSPPSEIDYDCVKKKACVGESWAFVVAFNNGTIFKNRRSIYNGRILPVRLSK